MCDLLVLAFQADVTRVCTFVLANEGSNRPYPFIGVPEGHHDLSHHGNDPKKHAKIRDDQHASTSTQFAYLLDEAEGDPGRRRHAARPLHDRLRQRQLATATATTTTTCRSCSPAAAAARSRPGRHVRYPKETPLNNLWLSMLDRMGVKVDRPRRQHRGSEGNLIIGTGRFVRGWDPGTRATKRASNRCATSPTGHATCGEKRVI